MKRRLAILLLCSAVLTLVGFRRLARIAAAPAASAGVVFYALAPRVPLRMAVGAATELELGVRFRAVDSAPRSLELVFRSLIGAELARETIDTLAPAPVERPTSTAPLTPAWISLVPPAGAAVLEVSAADEGALVRLIGATADLVPQSSRPHRTGIDAVFLTADERRRLAQLKWTALPALSDAATLVLPPSPQAEPDSGTAPAVPPAPTRAHADSNHSLAFNVQGPGAAIVRLDGHGGFVLRGVGPGAPDAREVEAPASLTFPLEPGPASIVVEARDGADADVNVALTGAAAAITGGSATPRSLGWYGLGRGVVQQYLLDGDAPLRLSACRAVPGPDDTLSWRLLRAGHELVRGSVALATGVDRFTFSSSAPALRGGASSGTGEQRAPLGTPVRQMLSPQGADTLELSAGADSLVRVDTWLEQGADPRPIDPFPEAPAGFHWLGVAARAPHWLALRPHGQQAGQVVAQPAVVERSPRLEAVAAKPAVATSFVSLRPAAGRAIELIEPTRHVSTHPATLLQVPSDIRLLVADAGARARQVTASCTARGPEGGELLLSIDGVVRARARMNVRSVHLRAAAAAGDRRVTLTGPAASCLVDARPSSGNGFVRRTAFELASGGSLRIAVDTGAEARTVHIAVYSADPGAGRLTARIDEGQPKRRPGAFDRSTIPEMQREFGSSSQTAVRLPQAASMHRWLTSVVLGDDLVPGHHALELHYEGSAPAWARFWTAGHRVRHEGVKLWIAEESAE